MKKFVMTAALAGVLAFAGSADAASMFTYDGGLLLVGSRGSEVVELQTCMNAAGHSTGIADGAFGPLTKAGVMSFQAAKGVVADGIVGPITAPLFEAACPMDGDDSDDDSADLSDFNTNSGEEGEIVSGSIDIDAGEDDELQSDKKGQEAFTFELEAEEEGSDVLIERVDLTFTITGDDTRGWRVMDAVSLEVDGDEVASENTDDKDDWRGSSDDTVRLSGINTVVEADEKVEFSVMVDLAELDLDTVDTVITLTDIEVRYVDEADVIKYESITGGTKTATAETLTGLDFDLDENNDNPDDLTISLNEDVDGVVAFVNDLEIDDERGTIETVTALFTFDAAPTAEDVDNLVNRAELMIDGDSYDDDTITHTTGATTFTIDFDLDEMDVDIDDMFEVSIELDLEELESTSAFVGLALTATSLTFVGEDSTGDAYTSAAISIDGASDMNLSAGVLVLDDSDIDGYNAVGSDDNAAKAIFTVELKADGDEDIRIDDFMVMYDGAAASATVASDYTVTVKDGSGDDVPLNATSTTLTTPYVINDGSTETFTMTVIYDNTSGAIGEYELEIDAVSWTEDTLGNGFASGTTSDSLEVSLEADAIDLVV